MKCVNFVKICIAQWTNIFQIANKYMMLQNHLWVKDPFKMQDRPIVFNVIDYEELIDDFELHITTNL